MEKMQEALSKVNRDLTILLALVRAAPRHASDFATQFPLDRKVVDIVNVLIGNLSTIRGSLNAKKKNAASAQRMQEDFAFLDKHPGSRSDQISELILMFGASDRQAERWVSAFRKKMNAAKRPSK